MYYKCELLIGGLSYSVTDNLKNWDDIEVSFKRNDYDGVVRSYSNSFEFVKGARRLLIDEYKSNYLQSSANVVIYIRNNSWTWTERFRCALNFSTLKDDGFTLSINAIDDSVAALIKAKKGTQYEYSVGEVCEQDKLYYDGLDIANSVSYIAGGTSVETNTPNMTANVIETTDKWFVMPMYISDNEYLIKKSLILTDSPQIDVDLPDLPKDTFFIYGERESIANINLSFTMNVEHNIGEQYSLHCNLYSISSTNQAAVILSRYINHESNDTFNQSLTVNESISIRINAGDRIVLMFYSSKHNTSVLFNNFRCVVKWNDKIDPILLDVINPEVLLNRLLKSMNGGVDGLTGIIIPSGEKRLDNCMILAAESCKKYPNAKIYTSFTKFANWMSYVFGYVYDINGKVITFRPRKDYFSNDVVKKINNYSGYNMSVNASLIYSQLNIGYEKQDYESVNGKDEFRFTNIYNTGNTLTDNKLEMVSPYRADAYGIEFLAQKIGEDTTDNSSDNTVFFVCATLSNGQYILDRSESITGVISPSTMFNVMYAPSSMIEANKDYLGGFISDLEYASSEGNTSVSINGNMENRDISLDGGVFTVGEVEVETSDIELPEDMTGIVTFEHQGETVQGYYKSADFSYSKTKSSKITLILKK